MGIPRFFKFLAKNYPDLILDDFILPNNSFVEGVYVDLNAVVHNVTKAMFRYGLDEKEITKGDLEAQRFYRSLSEEQRYAAVYKNVGLFLIYLFRKTNPLKIFMLALDGVAPKAKMDQQRERRYKRSKGETDFFNSVVISPGTSFMDGLDAYLTKNWSQEYAQFFTPGMNIIYSSHREPGEGEHKIFDQMNKDLKGKDRTRQMYGNNKIRSTPYQVVMGADSDLIILSLSKSNNIIFMRNRVEYKNVKDKDKEIETGPYMGLEQRGMLDAAISSGDFPICNIPLDQQSRQSVSMWQQLFKTGFSYINITDMRKSILNQYIGPNDIVDFTFISFFIGNDFLPSIPELKSIVTMTPFYFSDGDIEARFEDLFQQANLPDRRQKEIKTDKNLAKGKPGVNQPPGTNNKNLKAVAQEHVKRFNVNFFWDEFREKEPTWLLGDGRINFVGARGIWNPFDARWEIYPYVIEPITDIRKRKLLYKFDGANKWVTPMEDVGTLKKCLKIYSSLMKQIKYERRTMKTPIEETGLESFLVQKKNRINYPNVFRYLKELHSYISVFMKSELANYEELLRHGRDPDPLIEKSLGKEVTGKRTKPEIIPAAYAGLHNMRAFGIYDSKHADPKLPKQSIDEMCRKWFEGAQWTLVYYSNGLKGINTEWFYPYRDAPSILDLLHYLEDRLVCDVAGFPGIAYSCFDDYPPSVELIKLEEHIIFTYVDDNGKPIALLRHNFTGNSKYIDLDAVEFYKRYPTQKELALVEKEGKIVVIEISREVIKPKITKYYPLDDDIFNLVSTDNIGIESYASIVQSFFSIMPEAILKQLLKPEFVDLVLGYISDAFPITFEEVTDGLFYENQTEPIIPFLSPTRVQRAIETVLENTSGAFDREVTRYNQMKKRQMVKHGKVNEIGKVKTPIKITQNSFTSISGNATSAAASIQTTANTDNTAPRTEPRIAIPKPVVQKKKALWAASPAIDDSIITKSKGKGKETSQYSQEELAEIERFKQSKLDFSPFLLNNLPTYIPYSSAKKPNNNIHIGQRKLLTNEILFLLMYGNLSNTVVYVGAAPGTHIPILTTLFPNHTFHLWDSGDFIMEGTNKMNDKIKLFKKRFGKVEAEYYRDKFTNKGVKILLMSDIRSGKEGETLEQFEVGVNRDNILQSSWIAVMSPVVSMLKFRPPFILKKEDYNDPSKINYQYLSGPIWLQDWAPPMSAETRLIIDLRTPITQTTYNTVEFENKMYYFNLIIRNYASFNLSFSLKDEKGVDRVLGIKDNYDNAYEIWIWNQYFTARYPQSNQDQRNAGIIYTMNEVSRILGRDLLGRDISEGVSYKHRAPFNFPF